ncbi:predicted protein [Chaetomium globosum CBS 148.51]|uniref:Uncharacterized protein n=1 Tax=Chaetomium globosum (strain ATCC 6205 / CBS 148.51 / DSM 1962 / NBRC 6347 / NRRL 1970) TaxID=306901 RepID=Q2GPE4_CHAGB|nr:uncharacterized protein CHGG_10160 [Chaetomium globosum CBS 148.51]EAQ83756.1 predicted protein [Chaetomium globosum CBS 148.51]
MTGSRMCPCASCFGSTPQSNWRSDGFFGVQVQGAELIEKGEGFRIPPLEKVQTPNPYVTQLMTRFLVLQIRHSLHSQKACMIRVC